MSTLTASRVYPDGLDYYPTCLFLPYLTQRREEGLTYSQISRRYGYTRNSKARDKTKASRAGETSAVERLLGLRVGSSRKGGRDRTTKVVVGYEQAVRLCRALEIPYHEIGV